MHMTGRGASAIAKLPPHVHCILLSILCGERMTASVATWGPLRFFMSVALSRLSRLFAGDAGTIRGPAHRCFAGHGIPVDPSRPGG